MGNCSYGKEPFDLRLTVLRMLRNLDILLITTLIGTLLFGGGYYVKNVIFRGEKEYAATSTYKVEYVIDPNEVGAYYINEMSWNTFVDSKEFTDAVKKHLADLTLAYDSDISYSNAELEEMLSATLASDLRVPATIVTTTSQEKVVLVAQAVEMAMVNDFVENTKEITSIKVIDPALEANEVIPDVRPVRAFILSAVLSAFFTLVVLLLREIGNDSIWLPTTLRKRYGVKCVGTVHSKEAAANIAYLFAEKKNCAVCCVDDNMNPNEVLDVLQRFAADEPVQDTQGKQQKPIWFAAPTPILCPETGEVLRQADGVLLVVGAGSHVGKPLEYILEYMEQQDCKITAALLWDADETLINAYYFGQPMRKGL